MSLGAEEHPVCLAKASVPWPLWPATRLAGSARADLRSRRNADRHCLCARLRLAACAGRSRPADRRLAPAGVPLMDVERASELLAAERRELELALGHRGHQDDGENAGFQEPGNLAADLYLDELDESLADELRDRLAALERA